MIKQEFKKRNIGRKFGVFMSNYMTSYFYIGRVLLSNHAHFRRLPRMRRLPRSMDECCAQKKGHWEGSNGWNKGASRLERSDRTRLAHSSWPY